MQMTKMGLLGLMLTSALFCSTKGFAAECKTIGSHVSIAQIKSNYKNCTNCGAMKDSDGQKVFYCTCCGKKSETPTCTSSQYIVNNQCKTCPSYSVNNQCKDCPANATCDGTNVTCNSGYTRSARNGIVTCTPTTEDNTTCTSSQYIVNNQCSACPENATCDGKTATCNSGYTKSTSNGVVTCTATQNKCDSKQYLVGDQCTACPDNATCDGTGFTCNSGYVAKGLFCVSVDEAKLQQAQTLSDQVQAADMKTSAYKLGNKCQQGSHTSIDWIQKHFKNCSNCYEQTIPDGECTRVKGEHQHYYCFCDSCNDGTKTSSGSKQSSSKSSGSSCSKQGSHNSIAWIQSKYKNCVNCGSQTGSNGSVIYYCYCGDGCQGKSSGSSTSSGSSKGGSSSGSGSKKCQQVKECVKYASTPRKNGKRQCVEYKTVSKC